MTEQLRNNHHQYNHATQNNFVKDLSYQGRFIVHASLRVEGPDTLSLNRSSVRSPTGRFLLLPSFSMLCYAQSLSHIRLFATPWALVCQTCLSMGDSPGKNTKVGCHALLRGIFPTQGLNPGLLHYRQILYHLSHQGSLRILEWVT